MSITFILLLFTDGKFGEGSQFYSGEDKQMFRSKSGEGGEEERESWDSKLTFLLTTICCVVGLRNVWLFQYLSQNNMCGCYLCIVYCCHSFCENVSSISRQVLWPMYSNRMSD
jgi:hypothetical protein